MELKLKTFQKVLCYATNDVETKSVKCYDLKFRRYLQKTIENDYGRNGTDLAQIALLLFSISYCLVGLRRMIMAFEKT